MAIDRSNRTEGSRLEQARRLRGDAQMAKVFNSGLEVWLYDASHRDALKSSGAFETDADDALFEQKMKAFVKEGLIMAYQIMQDDSLRIAVAVGEPLNRKELASARWLKPQKAFLRLPSGRLVIESNDALTLRRETPTDPGSELALPPGDYLATLYRIDWDALEADELPWTGPNEFITLTPGAKAGPVRGQPALLPWEPRGPGKATWSVVENSYDGSALFYDDETAMCVALDPAGAEQLGMKDGSMSVVSVPALDFECVLVFVAGDTHKGEFYNRMERVRPSREYAGRQWAHCWFHPQAETLFCMRRLSKTRVPKKQQNVWHPATMCVVE
ncbi:MAG TPA: hypothetical protein VE262_12975 [Blastocatellia bacterium]|nr:hypothetical protein [Blastocatellia bacterium]